jgi:hypothetical protein
LTGLGYGVNLRIRYGEQDEEPPARDAHNSHVAIYARGGLISLSLWVLVWWTWFVHVLRVRRAAQLRGDSQRAGLAGWLIAAVIMILVNAIFDPTLEGPQVAIWTWALFGIGAVLRPAPPPRSPYPTRPIGEMMSSDGVMGNGNDLPAVSSGASRRSAPSGMSSVLSARPFQGEERGIGHATQRRQR